VIESVAFCDSTCNAIVLQTIHFWIFLPIHNMYPLYPASKLQTPAGIMVSLFLLSLMIPLVGTAVVLHASRGGLPVVAFRIAPVVVSWTFVTEGGKLVYHSISVACTFGKVATPLFDNTKSS